MGELDKLKEFLKLSYHFGWSSHDDITRCSWFGMGVVVDYISDNKTTEYRLNNGFTLYVMDLLVDLLI